MKNSVAVTFPQGALTRKFLCAPVCKTVRCRKHARILAFKEQDEIKDWRVKQMVDTCQVYYSNMWSRGDLSVADALLDPQFVYRDLCSVASWGLTAATSPLPPTGMVVGPRAFKALVGDIRAQYPDLFFEVDELAVSDTHRIFVSWTSLGTQLGAPPELTASSPAMSSRNKPSTPAPASAPTRVSSPASTHPASSSSSSSGNRRPMGPGAAAAAGAAASPPSYHNSLLRGVDVITFNHDRSRLLEVNVFRQLSSDERRDVERRLAPDPLEIRLARLHWEKPQ